MKNFELETWAFKISMFKNRTIYSKLFQKGYIPKQTSKGQVVVVGQAI